MTDKQITINGIKISKQDFIDNFSIELTNCNFSEREQIGNKYFDIILRKEQECESLKETNNENLELLIDRTKFIAEIAHKLGINDAIIEKKAIFTKLDQLKTENEKLKQALEQIKKVEKDMCILCREQYYNQHCEECNTVLILDIIDKTKGGVNGNT